MAEPLIRVEGLHFTYGDGTARAIAALHGIDLTIGVGEHVAIVGANGSGKSTLARHLNALLLPGAGDVWVQEWNTRDRAHWREIRRTVAMVFQDPDTQVVSTVVEEDVAFGPENLGMPPEELRQRVDWALEAVGMAGLRQRSPQHLSGGQRQRLALAGALAMRPACLVLDEATAMLDPAGQRAVHSIIQELHRGGMSIVAITHHIEEAAAADRVVVLESGRIARQGPPREVLIDEPFLCSVGLDLPPMVRVARLLHARWPDLPTDLLTPAEVAAAVRERAQGVTP